jgi:hypothetical protein
VTVSKELSKYKLDSVGVGKVRWGGLWYRTDRRMHFFYGKGNENHE